MQINMACLLSSEESGSNLKQRLSDMYENNKPNSFAFLTLKYSRTRFLKKSQTRVGIDLQAKYLVSHCHFFSYRTYLKSKGLPVFVFPFS